MATLKVSEATVRRLSGYYRRLCEMGNEGISTVSSALLAERNGVTPVQVRKDLSFFGNFGRRGRGYDVQELKNRIREILGLNQTWNVVLVGAGNLGQALFRYKEFRRHGFQIVAIIDNDPHKIGKIWGDLEVLGLENLKRTVKEKKIEIGIVTVPAESAQEVVDLLISTGVKAILNFASRKISTPPGVILRNVDMTIALEWLSYSLVRRV